MADPKRPPRNNLHAEVNIARLLSTWRNASWPVVHIRHASKEPSSDFWPGQEGAAFQDAFLPLPDEYVSEKSVTDAFSASLLEAYLCDRSIQSVVIVGVATNYSVEATARSAGCLGFDTIVVEDACFTFERCDLSGQPRCAHDIHMASLSNLEGEYARIASTSWVLDEQM
jgi:nicotinamidase-related amidase